MSVRSRSKLVALVLLCIVFSSLYVFHGLSMWEKALTLSEDASTSLSAYTKAAEWLSRNMKQNEVALVPQPEVFYATSSYLRDKLVGYKSLWDSANIILNAATTNEGVAKVRSVFINFVKENVQLRYIVRDWNDPYAGRLYEVTSTDDLMYILREVKSIPFTLSTGWGNEIKIYEKMQFTALFAMKFSNPPRQYGQLPLNTSVQFTSEGMTIRKSASYVGFYLPLESAIDASTQLNYLTVLIKPQINDLSLNIVFYYDANRDGVFSGYDTDYTKAGVFSQTNLGWTSGSWYNIAQEVPSAPDPVIQIAFTLEGDKDGSVTFADLIVYTETTSSPVFADAANWLLENLKENEVALVPSGGTFFTSNTGLKGKLVDYWSLWDSADVMLQANTTKEEALQVRDQFVEFLKTNPQVKYVVRDWVYPYAEQLFDAATDDELTLRLQQVQEMPFIIRPGWIRILTIYETVQYTSSLTLNFTSTSPPAYFTLPENASVQFASDSATIQKAGPSVNLYLPLQVGVDVSKQSYVEMRLKLNLENADIVFGFYYDVNRNGVFDGYDVDHYEVGDRFNQIQLGLATSEWYHIAQLIPNSPDPLVQIVILIGGETQGSFTISEMAVYTT